MTSKMLQVSRNSRLAHPTFGPVSDRCLDLRDIQIIIKPLLLRMETDLIPSRLDELTDFINVHPMLDWTKPHVNGFSTLLRLEAWHIKGKSTGYL